MSKDMSVYLFGVVENKEGLRFPEINLGGNKVEPYTIEHKGQRMIVTEVPNVIFDPNKQNLQAHQEVVASAMKQTTVIPMSFGTVLENKKDVQLLHVKLYDEFKKVFPKVRNKIEVGLKLIASKEWLEQEAEKHSEMKKLKNDVNEKKGKLHMYEQMKVGEAASVFVKGIHDRFEKEIFEPLAEIADAAKNNEVVGEKMVLNASFLVDLEKEDEFDQKINEFHDQWKDHLTFKYTGPWPAYNFIDIKVKAKRAS
ncbi:GvpL/GvpF family gas vesicle protein [Halalkalibacillus sediminis]|nr:GvpL/GvpF family gas vesicle protein [Halalkalibacillus sediminis]